MSYNGSPTRSWTDATRAFGSWLGAEFARIYGNTEYIKNQVAAINPPKGSISGGLLFNSVGLPPKIQAGNYEVAGTMVNYNSEQALATSDTLLESSQALESHAHYLVCIDNTGAKKYVLYGEGAIASATGNITSITGGGTTKTLTVATGTFPANAFTRGGILVITGNDGVNGVFKVASYISGTSITFLGLTGVTGGASGTWTLYDRINTLHGVGSATPIIVDADIAKYTPSLGENGWSAGIAAFDPTRNGYYLTISGLTGFRVIGTFRTGAAGAVLVDIFSYKTGRNKNDNQFDVGANGGFGATNTKCLRLTALDRALGCDYTLIPNDAALGLSLTFHRNLLCSAFYSGSNASTSHETAITINATTLTTTPINFPTSQIFGVKSESITNYTANSGGSSYVNKNDILRIQSNTEPTFNSNYTKFSGSLRL